MEKQKSLIIGLLLFLILLCIISFGTKGAHWDQINNKSYYKQQFSDIYRSLEGCIALDVFLIILYLTFLGLAIKLNETVYKFAVGFYVIFVFIRFILGIVFLAGEDESGRKMVDNWVSMSKDERDALSSEMSAYLRTFEGAFVFEIIDMILMNIVNVMMMLLMRASIVKELSVS